MQYLNEILEKTYLRIKVAKKNLSILEIKRRLLEVKQEESLFLENLHSQDKDIKIIAEIKKASPSKGVILKADTSILRIAQHYQSNGATAISILTEEYYFKGKIEDLKLIKDNTDVPILRKDFIVDEYQIYETKLFGGDAVLLIAKILDINELKKFKELCSELKIDILYEIHDHEDLDKILPLRPEIIGINNRDLSTFNVDIASSVKLLPEIPENSIKVCESGIKSYLDIQYLKSLGADAFLIGEAILESDDISLKMRSLLGYD